jgi:hypothetical protein
LPFSSTARYNPAANPQHKERDMKLVRAVVVALSIVSLSTASFAGDLQQSIAKAAQQQTQPQQTTIAKGYLLPGAALFVAGMSMVVYGFLHTSGGEFVSGQVSKESKTELGAAGLAVAGAGGAILYLGWHRGKSAPSVTVGRGRVGVTKKITW